MNTDYETLRNYLIHAEKLSKLYRDACVDSAEKRAKYETLDHLKKTAYAMSFEGLSDEIDSKTGKKLSITAREIMASSTNEYKKLLNELSIARLDYYKAWGKEKSIKQRIDIVEISISAYQSLMKIDK